MKLQRTLLLCSGERRSGVRRGLAAIATVLSLGPGGVLAQTAPGDWTGQPLPTTLSVPGGQTYNNNNEASLVYSAGPACLNSVGSQIGTGPCSPAQAASGDYTAALSIFPPRATLTTLPAAVTAPGSLASVGVQGSYLDSGSPTGVSNINAQIPLSAFATASSVSNETSRAQTAEANLSSEISAETSAREADISRVTRGYRMATASAIALSGMGILPGKKFNLSVNMGTYEGEWAVAAQGAYVVSEHAMLNAGVTSSATGSGTGARAGITLGW